MNIPKTDYSPWDLLPAPEPRTDNPPMGYFYNNVSKHLIPDIVRIMSNGIPIDLDKVKELEIVLDTVLADVDARLQANKHIIAYQKIQRHDQKLDYVSDKRSKMRPYSFYLKAFKQDDMLHRSYLMEEVVKAFPVEYRPQETYPTGVHKWKVTDVKHLQHTGGIIKLILNKAIKETNAYAKRAMIALAKDKATMYNEKYLQAINDVDTIEQPKFNVASSPQKMGLFNMLGLESEKLSAKTGLPSWDRDQLVRLNKEIVDEDIKLLTQAMIDYSFGAIIKNTFIPAFYENTHNGVLHGNLKLFGAKSFRLTSQNPNLLNMPSTRSIYSKAVKKCFVAPPGKIILTADYGALEDRVLASLTRDTNKCDIFLKDLDGHSLNALGYFKEDIAKHMTLTGDTEVDVKKFYQLAEDGNAELSGIRQKSKPPTFGLAYGAFPKKVASSLGIPLEEATEIFNRYHNELYPGITEYREGYVQSTAKANGRIHMGLGCYIYTNKAEKDIRTLHNGSCQFWSILTLLGINKIHKLSDLEDMDNKIACIATIYDSVYYIVDATPEVIKWLNDYLVPVMTKDFTENQVVKNVTAAQIGYSWADLHKIPNNASLDEIKEVLDRINNTDADV